MRREFPTWEEIDEVIAKTEAFKAEMRSGPKNTIKVEPRFVDKLTLARIVSPAVLSCRADLRAALEAEQQPTGATP